MTERNARDSGSATIVTLTMNPALDITTDTERVGPTEKMRCGTPRYDPGGGGINVARIAQVLGASAAAVFPAGGPAGDLVTKLLVDARVPAHRIRITGLTRESFTVNEHSTGQQYRFVLPGPRLTFAEQAHCLDELFTAMGSAPYVVASGSLPPGVPPNFYQRVADLCRERGVSFVLDTSGGGLAHIRSGVFLLKASIRELREYVGQDLETEFDQIAAAREIIGHGRAEVVVVSCGAGGALLVTSHGGQRCSALPVRAGSGVGAGDAMVAAIVVGLSRGWSLDKSVRLGTAAGAAMLLTPGTATCTRDDVERFFELVPEPVPVSTG